MLLSVRPRFAESIMNGTKLAEIRRKRPSAEVGTPVILYATHPIAALVGSARIVEICHGTPADMWADHHAEMDVSLEEFDNYLAGAATAYILVLTDAQRLHAPVTLDEMRTSAAFHPPRSYRYFTRDGLHELLDGHPEGGLLLDLFPA